MRLIFKKSLLIIFFGVMMSRVQTVRRRDISTYINSIIKKLQEELRDSKRDSGSLEGEEVRAVLGLRKDESLEPEDSILTRHKTVKVRFHETFKGLPVDGESVVLEMDHNGQFTGSATGRLLEGIEEDIAGINPALGKYEALIIALEVEGYHLKDIVADIDHHVKLVVFPHTESGDVAVTLAYDVTFFVARRRALPAQPRYTIDATSGEVLHRVNQLEGYGIKRQRRASWRDSHIRLTGVGGNIKEGKHVFGVDLDELVVRYDNGVCTMENDYVKLVNLNFSTNISHPSEAKAYEFQCDKEHPSDAVNGAYSPVNDAFFFFNKAYEMYTAWYGEKPFTDKLVLFTHYGTDLDMAFYVPFPSLIALGDGGDRFYPLVTMSVIGHEVSHGYTCTHSDLIYEGQSGAINEAFSDMAAIATEAFVSHTDWKIGSKITKVEEAYRYLREPTRDEKSILHASRFCPGMEVHFSSGVFNYAFYLLATSPGWTIKEAFHVFLIANKMYWSRRSDFADAACGAVTAAVDLGYSGQDVASVFLQVGVEPCQPQTYGIANMFDLSASSGEKIDFYLFLPGGRSATVQTRGTAGNLTITVKGHDMEAKDESVGVEKEMQLAASPRGEYKISLRASPLFEGVNLYVILSTVTVAKHLVAIRDAAYPESYTAEVTFSLTEEDLAEEDTSLVIRTSGMHGLYDMLTSWKTPVNIHSLIYEVAGKAISSTDQEALYCHPKPGTFHVVVSMPEHIKERHLTVSYSIVKSIEKL